MSTFTFITALFLPGTFMATFLSITMIDWQPGSLGASGTNSGASNGSTQVSKYYWVFWAIDIPLTIFVLLGWWVWFRHAKTTWVRENGIMLNANESKSAVSKSSRSSRSRSRQKRRSVIRRDTSSTNEGDTRSRRTLSIRVLSDGESDSDVVQVLEPATPEGLANARRQVGVRVRDVEKGRHVLHYRSETSGSPLANVLGFNGRR